MNSKPFLFSSIFWHYLNQRVFDRNSPLILDPHRFSRFYQVQYLERCFCRQYQPEERYRNQG
ncbi:MAG: hypothetical protein D6742_20305 [Cyanobacteria bacterium J069]|nr:MAG: hypothetical protein D6742_20305 [Cyanobacteria bacterium J069]